MIYLPDARLRNIIYIFVLHKIYKFGLILFFGVHAKLLREYVSSRSSRPAGAR